MVRITKVYVWCPLTLSSTVNHKNRLLYCWCNGEMEQSCFWSSQTRGSFFCHKRQAAFAWRRMAGQTFEQSRKMIAFPLAKLVVKNYVEIHERFVAFFCTFQNIFLSFKLYELVPFYLYYQLVFIFLDFVVGYFSPFFSIFISIKAVLGAGLTHD